MTRHHWRQQIKSFFEHHADPDKHERLKQTRKDMEEKKDKIIKLIKAEQQDGSNGKANSLEELINDYHKQYESLYEDHLNLTEELKKKAHRKKNKDQDKGKKSSSSSSSDSDSDSDSEEVTNGLQQRIIELENENAELRTKMVDLELNLRSSERKADELSRGNNQSHDQLVAELQTTIEDLKRDLEMDKDESTTIEEKNRNLEVMLRLSNQKKRVAEQILSEKEDKNAALSQTVQEYSSMIKDMSEKLNGSLGEIEFVIPEKFEEDYGGLVKSVVALCKEVESVRSREAASKSEKLEDEGRKEKEEMEKVVKEKEERIVMLGEEKREVIRQLCVWTEYYRSRCEELRGALLKIDSQAKNKATLMK